MPLGQGTLINYGSPIETVSDARLTTSVQTALQQRTDVNKTKIDELINSVTSIPLVREKDKEYLYSKLNGLIQTTNNALKTNSKGLMSNAVSNEINKYIGTAVDENILKQLANSKNIITFEKGVADLKAKKPDLYNDANYAYSKSKSGYDKYMAGEIDDVGSLEYNPYVDYKQTTMEKALKLKQLKGDQSIEIPDGRGGTTTTKISGLTPQEILEYFPSMITSQEDKQMAIDGWNALRGASPEQVKAQADNFFSTRRTLTESRLTEINALEESGTQSQKAEARRLKAVYNQDLESLNQKEQLVDKSNPEQVGYLLNRADFLNTASNLFSGRTSVTYGKDETFFAKLKLEQDLEEKLRKESKEGKIQDLADNQIYVSPTKNQEVQPADFYKDVRQNFNNSYNTVINTAQDAYNDLRTPSEIKTRYEATLKRDNYEIRNGEIVSTIPNNKVSKASVAETAFNESGMNNLPFGYDKKISEAGTVRNFLSNALLQAEKSFKKDLKIEQIVQDLDPLLRTFGADLLGGTDDNPEIKNLEQKYKNYIQSVGGINNFKEEDKGVLLNLVSEYNSIRKTGDPKTQNLKSVEIAEKAGEKLKTLGVDPFVKSNWTATIGNESLMTNIANSIPSQDIQGSALFNPKEGNFTVKKLNDNEIEITQAQGIKLDKDKKSIGITPARVVVVRGSDTFNLISQNINVEDTFTLDAQNTPNGFKIKPNIKPEFYSIDSELDFIQNLQGRYETNVSEKVRQEVQSRVGGYNVAKYFSSDEGTKEFLKAYIGDAVSKEQVDNLVNRISKNFDKYSIEYINNNKKNWMVRFSTPSGVEVMGNLNNNPELDGDYTYLLKNMPQLLIMTEVANYLKKSPSKIDSL